MGNKEVIVRKDLSIEMIEFVSKSAFPITLTGDTGAILLGYNKKTKEYGIAYYKKGESKPYKKESNLTSLDLAEHLESSGYEREIEEYCARMRQKEEEYSSLRTSLIAKLNMMTMSIEEKQNMTNVIRKLTTVPEYSKEDTRVNLSSKQDGDYWVDEYLRVGNEYDRTQGKAVQLITRVGTEDSAANTNYQSVSVEELVRLVRNNHIKVNNNKEEQDLIK